MLTDWGSEGRGRGGGRENVRETLDQLVLVADLTALVSGVLLRGLYLLGRGIGLAGDLSRREKEEKPTFS